MKGFTFARGDGMSETIFSKPRETTLDQHYSKAFSSQRARK